MAGRVALVAHVFYTDLLGEILGCHACLPPGADLIVTTPLDRAPRVREVLAQKEGARVVPVANRGRDIAPFLALLNSGELDRYDVVLKLHTKRSPHLRDGDIRRRLLFTTLAGSRRRVAQVLALFADPSTGLVGWRPSWRSHVLFWMLNRSRVEALADRMGVARPEIPTFFEGSMFWVRPSALRRLKELGLLAEMFEPEAGQTDGALHHAVERLFPTVAIADGFTVRDTAGRLLLAPAHPALEEAAA